MPDSTQPGGSGAGSTVEMCECAVAAMPHRHYLNGNEATRVIADLGQQVDQFRADLEAARAETAELRACANGFALNALQVLRQMTGSANDENPWLGVTAAVALLQSDLAHARARIEAMERVVAISREIDARKFPEHHACGNPARCAYVRQHRAIVALDAIQAAGGKS